MIGDGGAQVGTRTRNREERVVIEKSPNGRFVRVSHLLARLLTGRSGL
jgi:hypothetical protein